MGQPTADGPGARGDRGPSAVAEVITESSRKDDKVDAEMLARLARVDPKLLPPIRDRGEEAPMDLMTIRARAALLEARTGLVNAA